MVKEPNPHPILGPIWALWIVAMIVLLLIFPDVIRAHNALLGIFIVVEMVGVFWHNPYRDTLSGVIQWWVRYKSPHRIWYRGWCAAVSTLAMMVAYFSARQLYLAVDHAFISIGLFLGLTVFLIDHWIEPEKHG